MARELYGCSYGLRYKRSPPLAAPLRLSNRSWHICGARTNLSENCIIRIWLGRVGRFLFLREIMRWLLERSRPSGYTKVIKFPKLAKEDSKGKSLLQKSSSSTSSSMIQSSSTLEGLQGCPHSQYWRDVSRVSRLFCKSATDWLGTALTRVANGAAPQSGP